MEYFILIKYFSNMVRETLKYMFILIFWFLYVWLCFSVVLYHIYPKGTYYMSPFLAGQMCQWSFGIYIYIYIYI